MARNRKITQNPQQKELKKIGITCYPSVGGSGIIATELGMLLADKGYEVHFITSSMPFRLNQVHPKIFYHEVELNNYPVFQYPPYDLALASKMAEVIDQEHLDILHVHYAMPHAISAILAREISNHDIKIVTTLHGTDITVLGIDHTFKKMIKYGLESSDAVTAVSKDLVQQTKEMLETEKDIEVVYNFVNETEYYKKDSTDIKREFGISPDEKVLIHVSNFRKVKRIQDVIKTFAGVRKRLKAKLLLVGDGPEYTEMLEYVKQLQIEDDVLFLGKQNNISALFSISDLKLLLSEKESFGLVLLEAMNCEVPCVVTNIGGIPEVIEHGETGYIIELGNIEEAVQYSLKLLSDQSLHGLFSKNAFERARKLFNSEEIVRHYVQIYEKVFNQ